MNELYLSKAKEILEEWEGDVLELDYKISNREIPEHDNADAKMKIELWFGLQSVLQYIAALKRENETLREYAAILDYWFNPDKVPVNVKRVIGALRVKCASLLTAEEQEDE